MNNKTIINSVHSFVLILNVLANNLILHKSSGAKSAINSHTTQVSCGNLHNSAFAENGPVCCCSKWKNKILLLLLLRLLLLLLIIMIIIIHKNV